jgi:hypothetical protein
VTGRMLILSLLGGMEFVLILPALTGIAMLVLQWWGHHVWRYLAPDDYLSAMLYPFVGMVSGALAAVGLGAGVASNGRSGLGWVIAGIAVIVVASVGPAVIRHSQAGVPQRYSPNDLELQVRILAGRQYLSPGERQFFERRAAQDGLEAKRVTDEADRLTWTRYWDTRSRRKRFLAFGSVAAGASGAAALTWLSGNPLLLVAAPSGAGFLIALEADRRYRRCDARFRGSLLTHAAAEVNEHLERLETVPEPETDPRHGIFKELIFLLREGLTQRSGPRPRSPQVPVEGPSVTEQLQRDDQRIRATGTRQMSPRPDADDAVELAPAAAPSSVSSYYSSMSSKMLRPVAGCGASLGWLSGLRT